jgi:hypothetical protein
MGVLKAQASSAAVTVATVFANLMNKAHLHFSADEQLVVDALRRSSKALSDMPLSEMGGYLRSMDDASLRGLANNVKGIYHELQFVRRENLDGDAVTARIFPETNHPGADVVLSRDGHDFAELQLKATDNSSLLTKHFEKYPDISVAATDEVAGSLPGVRGSGFSDAALESDVKDAFSSVSDQAQISQLQDAAAVSGLLAAAMNAGDVLSGKVSAKEASKNTLRDMGVAVSSTFLVDLLFS